MHIVEFDRRFTHLSSVATALLRRASRMTGLKPLLYGRFRRLVQALLVALAALTPAADGQTAERTLRLLALGDSLTAGYLLPANDGFTAVLEKALRAKGRNVEVVNAGVSGDTSTGALERLDWAMGDGVDAAIVEIGANDMLRGMDPKITEKAIDAILTRLREKNVKILLAGMLATPSLGTEYKTAFDRIYPDLATRHGVPLYPFFLDGVAGQKDMQMTDGLHPTRAGVERIVAGILPFVEKALDAASAK